MFYNINEYGNKNGVYAIYNIITKYVYIGATYDSFFNRFRNHKTKLLQQKHNKLIQLDYNEYGIDSFKFIIIFVSDKLEEIKEKEIHYISHYKNINKSYNIYFGGENVGNIVSEQTKQKMSIAHKDFIFTIEHKEKISKSQLGKVLSDETKQKLSHRFGGSKSNFAILNEEKVKEIKIMIMNSFNISYIANLYQVSYACIKNIDLDYRWNHVFVEGWEEYQKSKHKKIKLTLEQEKEIVDRLKNGEKRNTIHKQFGISFDRINNIIKKYNL